MAEQLNLYQKLAKIRKPVEVLQTNRQGHHYTYVDEELILSKITGLMSKYGVSLYPSIVPGTMMVEPYHYTKTSATKDGNIFETQVNELLVHGDMTWTWVNNETPKEKIVVPWAYVASQADGSQAFGSGLTYAARYFLLKYFNVATTSDDPDNWRSAQREAEETESRLIAEKIIEEVHQFVSDHLTIHPDDKAEVIKITKKYAKENGRATANYYAIEQPEVATALLHDLKKTFTTTKEEK